MTIDGPILIFLATPINTPDKQCSLEYIWKMQLFRVGLALPFFSVVFQAGQFEAEDPEIESPWWSGLSFEVPLCQCACCVPFLLISQWGVVTSCSFRGCPTDVCMGISCSSAGACRNAGLRPYARPAESSLHFNKIPWWFLCTLMSEKQSGPRAPKFCSREIRKNQPEFYFTTHSIDYFKYGTLSPMRFPGKPMLAFSWV